MEIQEVITLLTILAIILWPILAVQSQKYIELIKENKSRRLKIFKTLMSTRGERLSRGHVQALNLIDMEFMENVYLIGVFSPNWKSP